MALLWTVCSKVPLGADLLVSCETLERGGFDGADDEMKEQIGRAHV